ncbi:hypothetical protein L9F63_017936 [Diploptera punctata]|uniref:Glutamate receptor ionotropic, kainate 2 n=1 Tax=Diploptera punctata TaxID=6984 RepID=A0AAD8EGJ1_DIPPU|nr:hypothetical protein L9F63_017936 [Diploptera punctata]
MAVLLLVLLLAVASGAPEVINIGGLFLNTEEYEAQVFQLTAEDISSNHSILRGQLLALPELVEPHNSLKVSQSVCSLLQLGVAGIFGPHAGTTSSQVQSICDTMDIPHIETSWDTNQQRQDFLVNLHPHPSTLAKLYAELVTAWGWQKFTILYEDKSGLVRLNNLIRMYEKYGLNDKKNEHTITIRQLDPLQNHRQILREIKRSGDNNIVLDCSVEFLPEVLKQAQQVGLMTSEQNFIITSMDLHTIDIEPYQYGGTNVTGFRMVDPDSEVVQMAVRRWQDLEMKRGKALDITPETLTLNMALIHDAVHLFARAMRRLDSPPVKNLDCGDLENWGHGASLINFMKDGQSMLRGLTGPIQFDNEGFRTNVVMDILELGYDGLISIGTWNSTDGLNLTRSLSPVFHQESESLVNKTFRVLTALSEPYGMLRQSSDALKGNARFEGFGIELIHELSVILGFNYTFDLQVDNVYGSLDKDTGQWTGMLRQIMDEKADLAITDLTISSEREAAVDFTMPFMNLGISILYKRPKKEAPKLFSFMSPFHTEVWICMCSVFLGVSVLLWIMGRLSPYEWTNPYPCIEEPEELENQFTFNNSLWFTIGSIMQQGADIAPISVSTRMVAGIWWFFTLIIVSSYTANLAAFLTVESTTTPFKNVKELANQKVIMYGAKGSGSTINFFRDSSDPTYQKMYQFMHDNAAEVLTSSNEQGLDWVKHKNYAYFMESTSIEYFTERHCEVAQVGDLLDAKGYGIAMRKNSTYRNQLSTTVLKLQESGKLSKMKNRWWKEERGGGKCEDAGSSGNPSALSLEHVGGVFLVLVVGLCLACFVTLFELLSHVRETSQNENVPFRQVLIEEWRFIARCHGSTKPMRKYNSQEKVSQQAEDSQDFVHMSSYGSSRYGLNTNGKQPLP